MKWDGPPADAWRPWTPDEVAAVMSGVAAPWCVVGGWAIDLWLGASTRIHGDIEVAVPRIFFEEVRRHLAGFELFEVGDGEVRALPHGAAVDDTKHQNWLLDPAQSVWRMDVMLEPGDATTWIFRRDERVAAARGRMVGARRGIPILMPEAVLLFKAKSHGEKDQADFEACLARLDVQARAWLGSALALAYPGHPWIQRLTQRHP
jgi:hypothetical protein